MSHSIADTMPSWRWRNCATASRPHLFITELRTIAADKLWMSMAYERPSLAIHFTWKPEWPAVKQVLPQIEAALEPFEPRPHWGKLFTLAPQKLESHYARLTNSKSW